MPIAADVAAGIVGGVMSGLDDLFTSDEEREVLANKREALQIALTQELNKPHNLQAMINLKEAEHPSVFVSGWRPGLGWLTVFCLGYAWIVRDLLVMMLVLTDTEKEVLELLPSIQSGDLMTLVLALLGLGGIRSYEKIKGVARGGWGNK